MKFLLLIIAVTSLASYAGEFTESSFGAARIVNREFKFTPKECLAMMPLNGSPRQIWKCVYVDPKAGNAFSFNPALEHKDSGRPYGTGIAADIIITIESHPRGGSISISAPDRTHPGYSRVINYEEMKNVLQTINQLPTIFRGTYLAAP